MELVETRDLDGPNYFAPYPVIKLEISHAAGERIAAAPRAAARDRFGVDFPDDLHAAFRLAIAGLFAELDLPEPETLRVALDEPGHVAVAFAWEWRESALLIARTAYEVLAGLPSTTSTADLRRVLAEDQAKGDRPLWVEDTDRRLPSVGITGTNGKTTTTRLIAHIVRTAGLHVGWSSSTGVYIDGEQVIEGDYTGPSGARRVLNDPAVDVAVLETARGGILLRGLAYQSNDVGVFLNVSPDHLDLQGVKTVETLAQVKGIVVRVTRPAGLVVLNADDPLVLHQREQVSTALLLFSQRPDNPAVAEHELAGGQTLVRAGDEIVWFDGQQRQVLLTVADLPMTFGGIARHMVENALAATGAAIGLGLDLDAIRAGLCSFRSDMHSNVGRLNVFRVDGRIVVVDYAHNESGLDELITFTRALMGGGGKLAVIIGTAGDRQDEVLRGLGRIACERADLVFLKENPGYLRGRESGEQVAQMRIGVELVDGTDRLAGAYDGERLALVDAIARTASGDAIAVMCVEEQLAVFRELRDRGAREWDG